MDKKVEILLNSYKNIESVNTDLYEKIELSNNPNRITEYDIRNVLSATEVFDAEREANQVYRIYGKIEYMSMLNGLIKDYQRLPNFFNPDYTGNSKNILNSFNFYLVRPAVSGYTNVNGAGTNMWVRYFQVVATPAQFEIFPAGFGNNVFGEQSYAFNFSADVDISYLQDEFGFPVTELFLYVEYIKSTTPAETLSFTRWSNTGVVTISTNSTTSLNIGDYVKMTTGDKVGDLIEYAASEFYQTQLSPQIFYIKTPYVDGYTPKFLRWKYNPFIPIRLRYFTDNLYKANTGGTLYDQVNSIPYYATEIDNNGNFVWRNIMPEGYTDPLTGIGTNHPFVNKRRYVFTSIILDVTPDLGDTDTRNAFAQIWFGRYQKTLYTQPTGDINNIGKPCQ